MAGMHPLNISELSKTSTQTVPEKEFDDIYAAHYPKIVDYLRSRGAGDDAEDIAQETFINALQHLDRYRGGQGRLGWWLQAISRNAQIDHYRKGKVAINPIGDVGLLDQISPAREDDTSWTAIENSVFAEVLLDLMKALRKIDSRHSELLRLVMSGHSYDEISELLDIERSKVSARVFRGRRALKAAGIEPIH